MRKRFGAPSQDFTVGNFVSIGFMKDLKVVGVSKYTSYQGHLVYFLESAKGTKYKWSSYEGIEKVSFFE